MTDTDFIIDFNVIFLIVIGWITAYGESIDKIFEFVK